MGVALLDSVVIVAFLDASHEFHAAADAAVVGIGDGQVVASVVTFAELMTGAHLGYRDEQVVREFFEDVVDVIVAVDVQVAERAAELRGTRPALKMPDALILATGDLHAGTAITADGMWASLPSSCDVVTLVA